ncbi:MAG: M2 family metallopeptidase, partial [Gammaproteobacteria bacterium]|nr:M2 family metallopeptidase [Gammaproteobacteria bacterium]
MKNLVKLCASLALVMLTVACSEEAPEETTAAAPTETAQAFVARVNDELRELGREIEAAQWVRSTYITGDTAVLATAASARYAKWHSETVQQAVAYDGQDLDPATRRALDLLKLGTSAP